MLFRGPRQRNPVQHFSNDEMGLSGGEILPYHQIVHPHPKHCPGDARRLGLDHDPLDHHPPPPPFSARNSALQASALEIFSGKGFEGARRQPDRENNIVIGGKQERGRPFYRKIEGLRVAVGLNRVRGHIVGTPRNMRDVVQIRSSPFAATIARIRASPSAGLYSRRFGRSRNPFRFPPCGDDP
jgi:hypothetical protein